MSSTLLNVKASSLLTTASHGGSWRTSYLLRLVLHLKVGMVRLRLLELIVDLDLANMEVLTRILMHQGRLMTKPLLVS